MIREKTRWIALAALGLTACAPSAKQPATTSTVSTSPTTTAPASTPVEAEHVQEKHLLWKIETGGGTVYLLGSIHLVKPDIYPLSPVIQRAFEASDVVGFEVDLGQAMKVAPLAKKLGQYPGDQTLESELDAETYSRLKKELVDLGMGIEPFKKVEPWLLSLTITQLVLAKSGYGPGIDMHLYNKAKAAGKEIVALETFEYQVRTLDGIPADEQEAALREMAADVDGIEAQIRAITDAWRVGDAATIAKILQEDMGQFEVTWQKLIVGRNQNWIPKIEALINGDKNAIVVVGAGHLVGEDSVVQMLRANGHTVTQL